MRCFSAQNSRAAGWFSNGVRALFPLLALAAPAVLPTPAFAAAGAEDELLDLSRLSIDELVQLPVTSVSRRAQPVLEAPASIFVITPDDIRRSGALTIPETLRLAPNLNVRREDSLNYAISARGFTTFESSNKLLAMIDGRSIYSSLHSGVFWDDNDVMLDDVARIEVVSGPGGTLWGANAVNGVVNIVTKSSKETQGVFIKGGGGTLDRSGAARYGGQLNANLTYRVYVKMLSHDSLETATGANAHDAYTNVQGGFRSDWEGQADNITFQGDIRSGHSDDGAGIKEAGGNVLARWNHESEHSASRVQVYYDKTLRKAPGVREISDAYDIDLQHNMRFGRHDVVVGGGYRRTTDTFAIPGNIFNFAQPTRSLNIGNIYGQDTIALTGTLRVIGGVKFEHNDFTGWEIMPNLRLAWQPTRSHMLWASVSRAVRTPSRIDRELQAMPLLAPATDFQSEQLLAYEAGYRGQLSPALAVSVSTYYDVYQDIRATEFAPITLFPIQFRNDFSGHIYGVEFWAKYRVAPWWQLSAGVNAMHKNLRLKPGAVVENVDQSIGNDPGYDASLRSSFAITHAVDLDVALIFEDSLPAPFIPAYTELNARLAWRVTDKIELAVDGQNLLHRRHAETGLPTKRQEIPRSIYATARAVF
jgi:iron complex outermembrane receptor protein